MKARDIFRQAVRNSGKRYQIELNGSYYRLVLGEKVIYDNPQKQCFYYLDESYTFFANYIANF